MVQFLLVTHYLVQCRLVTLMLVETSVGISRPSGIIYVGNSVPGRKSVSGNSSVSISVPGKTYVDDSGGVVGAISGDDVAFRRACKGKGTY